MAHHRRTVGAGLAIALTGRSLFDPRIGFAVAFWPVVSTLRELQTSSGDLLWPEEMKCGHEVA